MTNKFIKGISILGLGLVGFSASSVIAHADTVKTDLIDNNVKYGELVFQYDAEMTVGEPSDITANFKTDYLLSNQSLSYGYMLKKFGFADASEGTIATKKFPAEGIYYESQLEPYYLGFMYSERNPTFNYGDFSKDFIMTVIPSKEGPVEIKGLATTSALGTTSSTTLFDTPETPVSINVDVVAAANKNYFNVKNSTIAYSGQWDKKDNFIPGKKSDGSDLTIDDVTIDKSVDTLTPGTQDIVYSYTDSDNNVISHTAVVTVLPKSETSTISTKNVTLYQGDVWDEYAGVQEFKDANGVNLDLNLLTISGDTVDTSKSGTYNIVYSYQGISETATITVKENLSEFIVKDSQILVGSKWAKQDNIVTAVDVDGKEIPLDNISVEGNVDTSVAGTHKVKYTATMNGVQKIAEAQITVVDENDASGSIASGSNTSGSNTSGSNTSGSNTSGSNTSGDKSSFPKTNQVKGTMLFGIIGTIIVFLAGLTIIFKKKYIKE